MTLGLECRHNGGIIHPQFISNNLWRLSSASPDPRSNMVPQSVIGLTNGAPSTFSMIYRQSDASSLFHVAMGLARRRSPHQIVSIKAGFQSVSPDERERVMRLWVDVYACHIEPGSVKPHRRPSGAAEQVQCFRAHSQIQCFFPALSHSHSPMVITVMAVRVTATANGITAIALANRRRVVFNVFSPAR